MFVCVGGGVGWGGGERVGLSRCPILPDQCVFKISLTLVISFTVIISDGISNLWDFFPAFLLHADLIKNQLFFLILSEYHQCQTVWIQIRPNRTLLGLIWVQTVCNSYQQKLLGDKEPTILYLWLLS